MKLRSKKGFSLVELIIVIAIMGIIAVIAIPNLTGIQQRSKVNADIRTAEQIGKAVKIWLVEDIPGVSRTLPATWTAYDATSFDKMSEYISIGYVPQSASSLKFVVKAGDAGEVWVAIGETGETISNLYTTAGTPGIAYKEGQVL